MPQSLHSDSQLEPKNKFKTYSNLFLSTVSVLILGSFLTLLISRTLSQVIVDHVEGQIGSLSWLFFDQNYPLYHGFDNTERYTIVYGPLLYIITGAFLKILGPSIWALKLPTTLALGGSFILIFAVIQKIHNRKLALWITAYTSVILLCFGTIYGHIFFFIRSDSIILLFTCLALWGVLQNHRIYSSILLSLCFGIVFNLKITAVLYFLPLYWLFLTQQGLTISLISGFAGIIIGFLPFLHPQISWTNYFQWLTVTTNHGFYANLFFDNIRTTIYLFLPILILGTSLFIHNKKLFHQTLKDIQYYLYFLLFSTAGTIVIASKGGAGSHHLIPLIPAILYPFLLLLKKHNPFDVKKLWSEGESIFTQPITFLIFCFALILISLNNAGVKAVLLDRFYRFDISLITGDIELILETYPDQTIEMGYTTDEQYFLTNYRFLLPFQGNPILIDGAALMDMQTNGFEIPNSTIEALASCRTQIWLIPKDWEQETQPFLQLNYYPPHALLFSPEFRQTFLQSYEPRIDSEFFHLWFCKDELE
ncbi:ArnT family glycosyltransferase [Spirulina subsalsa]|uniref:ArnT family glycosyltransferase n=1 Tax=Spirulina subsalsa TaxID=54311 RepID=UPI00035C2363|nr:glycosyltransferase family 39 protein [Spirulina subsalsa]